MIIPGSGHMPLVENAGTCAKAWLAFTQKAQRSVGNCSDDWISDNRCGRNVACYVSSLKNYRNRTRYSMFERLNQIEAKYDELTRALSSPEVINDSSRYQKTAKAHSEVAEIVEKYREYKDLSRGIEESKAMVAEEADAELRAYAQEELARLGERLAQVENDLKLLLLPKDPNDEKNVILEIRAGTGGDEARSLPPKCSACTRALPKRHAGRSKFCRLRNPASADSRK